MPAYLRPFREPQCYWPGCGQEATHELRSGQNLPIGDYCRQHGPIALARFEEPQPTNEENP